MYLNTSQYYTGRRLIDLCISCSLLILKIRLGSDNGVGAYTRIDTTGKSVVDYMIDSPELFAKSSDFPVHDKFTESDHVPLSIAINCRLSEDKPRKDRTDTKIWTKHYRYKRSAIALRELKTILIDEKSAPFREKMLDSFIELKSRNELATCFTDYITQAADRTLEKNMSKSLTSRKGPG